LQQHGATLQQGQPFDRTNPTFQAAAQACASLRPARSTTTSPTT
jgi:hypothetical protein